MTTIALQIGRNTTAFRIQEPITTYFPVAEEVEVRSEEELMAEGYTLFAAADRATADSMLAVGFETLPSEQH